ncbi:hypothetical protein F3Y22_tig00110831pilonHSYRG00257 [Hibiscus syriacus]|uniref:Uncharacterized protein n=1 Tax=Hibiscus syriacus TaxID=106335 RepID=A0A6A2ZLQ5_HIBSY|nr:hypothetical protein F3Y22_tig00110831pilonHSYRG00257 [Hibiscus syriacus]
MLTTVLRWVVVIFFLCFLLSVRYLFVALSGLLVAVSVLLLLFLLSHVLPPSSFILQCSTWGDDEAFLEASMGWRGTDGGVAAAEASTWRWRLSRGDGWPSGILEAAGAHWKRRLGARV